LQRYNLKSLFLILALILVFSCSALLSASTEKKGFLELRGGLANYSAQVTNRTFGFNFPSVDLTIGGKIGYMQSIFNIGFFGATTNSIQTINGNTTNSGETNRLFIARAFSLEFTEYFPITLLGEKFTLSPGIDIKFAHYNDVSAEKEFSNPTKDYMYTFLRLALKAEARFSSISIGAEYRYPILGNLTDKILKENRFETYLNIYARYDYSELYAKFGFDYSKLTYSNPLLNSAGQSYRFRSLGTLYISLGVKF
jgi:hypothetical protein